MGKHFPTVTAKQVAKVLRKKGFYFVRQRGSHQIWTNGTDKWTTLPVHPGEDVGRGLLQSILKDLKVTNEEFTKFL